MGYAGGADIAQALIPVIEARVPAFADRKAIYAALIRALEHADWDTQSEALGLSTAFDACLQDAHPNWFEGDGRFAR